MAKSRMIYGVGPMAARTLPRSRTARERLLTLLRPARAKTGGLGLLTLTADQRALVSRAIRAARANPELAQLARAAWNDRELLEQIAAVLRQQSTRDALLAAIDARIAALGGN